MFRVASVGEDSERPELLGTLADMEAPLRLTSPPPKPCHTHPFEPAIIVRMPSERDVVHAKAISAKPLEPILGIAPKRAPGMR